MTTGIIFCRFCRDVQEGKISVVADDWPTFLYPEDGYDPNAIDVGLLQGPFLLSVSILAYFDVI
jgi:hypothetical protein